MDSKQSVTVVVGPEPRYRWKETWPGEGHKDYAAWDGDVQFGRIFLEPAGLTKDKWRWAISHIEGVKRQLMPNSGWALSARLAAARVEDFYERLMDHNGMPYPRAPYRLANHSDNTAARASAA